MFAVVSKSPLLLAEAGKCSLSRCVLIQVREETRAHWINGHLGHIKLRIFGVCHVDKLLIRMMMVKSVAIDTRGSQNVANKELILDCNYCKNKVK